MERTAAYRMREAIQNYWDQAQEIRRKMDQDKKTYAPEFWHGVKETYEKELATGRDVAVQKVYLATEEACDEIREWGTLRGEDMTPDAKLLTSGVVIRPDELREMLDKYRDNYTMGRVIRDYLVTHKDAIDAAFDPALYQADERAERLKTVGKMADSAISLINTISTPTEELDLLTAATLEHQVTSWGLRAIETARG